MLIQRCVIIAAAAVALTVAAKPNVSAQESDCGWAYGVRDLREPNNPVYGDVFDSCPQYWETYYDAGFRHDKHTNVQLHSPETHEACD